MNKDLLAQFLKKLKNDLLVQNSKMVKECIEKENTLDKEFYLGQYVGVDRTIRHIESYMTTTNGV